MSEILKPATLRFIDSGQFGHVLVEWFEDTFYGEPELKVFPVKISDHTQAMIIQVLKDNGLVATNAKEFGL